MFGASSELASIMEFGFKFESESGLKISLQPRRVIALPGKTVGTNGSLFYTTTLYQADVN